MLVTGGAAEMIGKPLTLVGAIPKTRTESRPTALGPGRSYRSRGRQIRGRGCLLGIHLHPIDDGEEIVTLRSNRRTGSRSGATRAAGVPR